MNLKEVPGWDPTPFSRLAEGGSFSTLVFCCEESCWWRDIFPCGEMGSSVGGLSIRLLASSFGNTPFICFLVSALDPSLFLMGEDGAENGG